MNDKRAKIFSILEAAAPIIPAPVFWMDINGVGLGCNDLVFNIAQAALDIKSLIGRTVYEYHPKDIADTIMKNIRQVMQEKRMIEFEEVIKDKNGKVRVFLSTRAPLFDDNGIDVVGSIYAAIEITERKEAERLQLETEKQKLIIANQEKFKKVAAQVAHDIRSPLSSLLMTLEAYKAELPEKARSILQAAAISIRGIASSLLDESEPEASSIETKQPLIVSLVLLDILSSKQHQYKESSVKFTYEFAKESLFALVNLKPISFKRMLSNLINNAVEAYDDKNKEEMVRVKLETVNNQLKITIQDQGKGISQKLAKRILDNEEIKTDKKGGHGVGLGQIRDSLKENQGQLAIESQPGKGTKMILTFALAESPRWLVKRVSINEGDIVVVLDDDGSIHGAWDLRLDNYAKAGRIKVKHFTEGKEAVAFINSFPRQDKIFLLTDFELLRQNLNGIEVIERTKVKRAILVTSRYAEKTIHDLALAAGVDILHKQLASEIPLEVVKIAKTDSNSASSKKYKNIDVVVIDDNAMVADTTTLFFEAYQKKVDKYYNPLLFLKEVEGYDPKTIFCIDHVFPGKITGIELAEKLCKLGFTRLYLFSGNTFFQHELPHYLVAISKTDTEALANLAKA